MNVIGTQLRDPMNSGLARWRMAMIEFRCVVTVNTSAVWLARENIKRLTPRPCINVEYSHGVVYMEETTSVFHSGHYGRPSIPIIYISNPFYQMTVPVSMCLSNLNSPPTRHEILSQKFFMNCQVKRQYINLKYKNHPSFESR